MANGKSNKRLIRAAKKALGGRNLKPKSRGGARLKKILGMREHPTAAGQAKFGAVDVTGAQMTPKEEQRAGALAGRTPFHDPITGAQMTEAERRRLKGGR